MLHLIKSATWLTILIVFWVSMFTVAEWVNAWEVANNYPYGKLCEFYNNC